MKEYSYYGFNEFVICAGYKQHVSKSGLQIIFCILLILRLILRMEMTLLYMIGIQSHGRLR